MRFGRMAQKIAVLVNRAALDRQLRAPECDEGCLKAGGAVDDDELRPCEPACIEVVDELAPCGFALTAHIFDGKQAPSARRDARR